MNKLTRTFWTAQALGWGNLPRRVLQIAKHKLKVLEKRLPAGELSADELRSQFTPNYAPANARHYWQNRAAAFGFSTISRSNLAQQLHATIADESAANKLRASAARISQGEFPFFNHRWEKLGNPPNFQHDPIHNVTWPTGQHWTTYGQFNPDRADLKCVWEASRFSWAYLLARAHALDPACDAAKTFWSHFEAWDQQNPYGSTAQWACGQESSFRLFAWLFAASATLDSPATTDARLARLSELVWYTGRHVAENIVYARSQKNNHAISEAAALWLIGSLFTELEAAEEWRTQGLRVLEAEVARQIYPDGSYVQHSLNYHRVMLDDLLLVLSVARRLGVSFSERLQAKFEVATRWLLDFVDPETGVVANYGANDGALVLPLSTCDYDDFRPVACAAANFADLPTRFGSGPWDEKLFWLAGFDAVRRADPTNAENSAIRDESKTKRLGGSLALPDSAESRRLGGSLALPNEESQQSVARRDGGYFHLRGEHSHAMIRCHTYTDRPGQADMLHLDMTYRGVNVLRDGGSYYYYTKQPWHDWFYSTAAHNTIEVDSADQMIKGPRFLWLRWTKADCRRWFSRPELDLDYFRGAHFGYARLAGRIVHERTVLRIHDSYAVIDEVTGSGLHDLALRWRLCDVNWQQVGNAWIADVAEDAFQIRLASSAPISTRLARGEEAPHVEGWESRYYAVKTPIPTIVARTSSELPVRFVTVFEAKNASESIFELVPDAALLRIRRATPAVTAFFAQLDDWRIETRVN